jgi:HEAT repeat protein/cyclophilin family peptidyl-prolyl cis-trans isomerase
VRTRLSVLICLVTLASPVVAQQRGSRPPLTSADIDTIAAILMMEDTRKFDEATLASVLQSAHPEVRRRAVLAAGRVIDTPNQRGRALLAGMRGERDPEILATIAFSTGQLKDPDAVAWLAHLLTDPQTAPVVAKEAACALGKIRTPDARIALANYLTSATATTASVPTIGEALLSIGRFQRGDDLAPIIKWATATSVEIRWRAAWALFRLRDALAFPTLMKLADDPSGEVRYWAVRGLAPIPPPAPARGRGAAGAGAAAPAPPPPPPLDPDQAAKMSGRLRAAMKDADRRVRTEALRALGTYEDDASFGAVLAALDSPDTWMSVSAAEALGRMTARSAVVAPKLVAAAAPSKPTALRLTALTPLVTMAPEKAIEIAASLAVDKSITARTMAVQALGRLGDPGRVRLDALKADPATGKLIPETGGGNQAPRPAPIPRTQADYRAIVERWIVPDYNGAPKPHSIWTTPRGEIEIELFPGDAPIAADYFLTLVTSGAIVGTEFGRVVPNFVAQQRTIIGAMTLRDEVNRRGLTRANLSWASAGLDTGRPGYTLGNTPQPHNEGDFTSLGRVIRGMDVVDRLELGDAVTAARMKK